MIRRLYRKSFDIPAPRTTRPPGGSRLYTYEPCDYVDPAPDYENVLTD